MIVVGNLLTDPAAQSFISLADADAYLAPENVAAWDAASTESREAALVRASRWLVATFPILPLDPEGMLRIGHIVARLAAETIDKPLFAGIETGKQIKRAKAGSAEIEYADGLRADAAGMAWPWLRAALMGLVANAGAIRRVVRS